MTRLSRAASRIAAAHPVAAMAGQGDPAEVRTRTGRLRFEAGDDRFVVAAHGHIGPRLVREDLRRAAQFGHRHGPGWWYVVDTTGVRLPNPLNLRHLRRIRDLPGLAGYVVIAPAAPLRAVARLLAPLSRPDAVVRSRQVADSFVEQRDRPDALPVFVYDGDCGFCAKWARWITDRADPPIRLQPLASDTDPVGAGPGAHGLTARDIEQSSFFVDEAGVAHGGSDGFAEVLARSRGLWPVLGLLGRLPVLRRALGGAYRLVARNRHRLPGPPGS